MNDDTPRMRIARAGAEAFNKRWRKAWPVLMLEAFFAGVPIHYAFQEESSAPESVLVACLSVICMIFALWTHYTSAEMMGAEAKIRTAKKELDALQPSTDDSDQWLDDIEGILADQEDREDRDK